MMPSWNPPSRVVEPELLDALPATDPDARRSRRDLARINFLMGNDRWVLRTIAHHHPQPGTEIHEWGAGTGDLFRKLAAAFSACTITGHDLVPPPPDLPRNGRWQQGDLLETPIPSEQDSRSRCGNQREDPVTQTPQVVVANLFLHHFESPQLARLGECCRSAELVIINEPLRAKLPHLLGGILWPVINHVTRNDMHVSIRAGFRVGELPCALGLDRADWNLWESCTWRGSVRVVACRR